MRKLVAAVIFLLCIQSASAQDSIFFKNSIDVPMRGRTYLPCLSVNNLFVGDYLVGVGSGVYNRTHNWSARINFDFRPYFKTVTFAESDVVHHQYKERDFFLNLAIEKEFRLKTQYPMLLPFVQVSGGLLWGNFKAFHKAPESKWVVSPAAGFNLALNRILNFKLGYQYLKPLVLLTTAHRIFLQVLFTIDDIE